MAKVILTDEEKRAVISEHFAQMGKKGGRANFEKHGAEHMSRISKLKTGKTYKKRSKPEENHDKETITGDSE